MTEDQNNHKGKGDKEPPAADDSTTEMEIISEVFAEKPSATSSNHIFSQDLFSEPPPAPAPPPPSPPRSVSPAASQEKSPLPAQPAEKKSPASPPPSPEILPPSPSPPPSPAPLPSLPQEAVIPPPSPPPPAPAAPSHPPAPSTESIKIVTDEDLRLLFDLSSPGQAQPEPETVLPPAEKEALLAAREEIKEEEDTTLKFPEAKIIDDVGDEISEFEKIVFLQEEIPPAAETEVETTALSGPPSDSEKEAPAESEPETGPSPSSPEKLLDEISPEEIVDQLETAAEVGEMRTVAAGKKGELLERTRELLSLIEPAADDFMNVAELHKLFRNVNLLIDLAHSLSERLSELEARCEALERGSRSKEEEK